MVRIGVFRKKNRFIKKRDPGLFQNKVMLPIFKRKIAEIENLRFLEISEKCI